MTRRVKQLIKRFNFEEDNRPLITFGPSVRMDPRLNFLQLAADSTGAYPTTADLFAKTRLWAPATAKRWTQFEAVVTQAENELNQQVTDVKYRLSTDGANQLWWNGAAWTAAAPGQWNTEAEVANNIAALVTRSIQVIVNPSTTDKRFTPRLTAVKLGWDSDIVFDDEYIGRSLIPALREEIRPIAELAIQTTASTTTADLNAIETPYDIQGIDSVYNTTDDPAKLVDLAVSYDAGTKIATFAAVPAGKVVLIRFTFAPVVAIVTDQDFTELDKIPAITIESITESYSREIPIGESVINKSTGAGYQLVHGHQCDIDFLIRVTTDKEKDYNAVVEQLDRFFSERLLLARGQDELFRVRLTDDYNHQTAIGQGSLHTGRLRGRISNAVFYVRDAQPVHATTRFVVSGGNVNFQV